MATKIFSDESIVSASRSSVEFNFQEHMRFLACMLLLFTHRKKDARTLDPKAKEEVRRRAIQMLKNTL